MRLGSLKSAALLVLLLGAAAGTTPALAQAGVANCAKARAASLEGWLCKDESLMALDKKMAEVLSAAEPIAAKEKPPMLKAEQRGWGTKSRDECLKADDKPGCLKLSYQRRIAELQASYALLAPTGKARVQMQTKVGHEAHTLASFLVKKGGYDPETGLYLDVEPTKRTKVGLVVIDECLHAIAPSYTGLLKFLDAEAPRLGSQPRDEPPVIGLSATNSCCQSTFNCGEW